MRLVKPASNYAQGKIDRANRNLRRWTIRGAIPLLLAAPVGLGISLLDSFTGTLAGAMSAAAGVLLILVGIIMWTGEWSTRKGWQGEQQVAAELSHLNDDFLLLNDVMLPGGHGNIDHILVGPTGVFVFETKNYSGKYVCYGDKWYFQGKREKYEVNSVSLQAKNNAAIVAGLLYSSGFTVEVTPIIVFSHPSAKLWLHHPTIPVLERGTICNFVLSQRPKFQLTAQYAQKVADKIIYSDRARPLARMTPA